MGKGTRKKLFVDKSRIWNFATNTTDRKQLRSFMFGYFWYAESHFGINQRNLVWALRDLTNLEKNWYIRYFDTRRRSQESLYTGWEKQRTVLKPLLFAQTNFYESRTEYMFVPKFYHDRANSGFLKYLRYIDKIQGNNTISELGPECGRTLYVYKSDSTRTIAVSDNELNWCFSGKYSLNKGLAVSSFTFTFRNLKNSFKKLLEPSIDLINEETGTESTTSVPTQNFFFRAKK